MKTASALQDSGRPQEFGTWLQRFTPIHAREHWKGWGWCKAWLSQDSISPKGVEWGSGQGSVQARQVLPHQETKKNK